MPRCKSCWNGWRKPNSWPATAAAGVQTSPPPAGARALFNPRLRILARSWGGKARGGESTEYPAPVPGGRGGPLAEKPTDTPLTPRPGDDGPRLSEETRKNPPTPSPAADSVLGTPYSVPVEPPAKPI